MSNWEKEVNQWLRNDYGLLEADTAFTAGELVEILEEAVKFFITKQRTQLLKEVREKVNECVCDSTQHGHLFKDEILKKLKELEEGK